ncbi:MAG TPA: HD domain-containing protein [Bryobacteraceae bacterium]|nr:HD domain-containing protein [Bryobacteraceae bacterium]
MNGSPTEPQELLARAVALAAVAHARQLDKAGKAYILHPMRVMQRCGPHGEAAQIVAVLHDVVEDTWVTLEMLREMGFPEEIVEAVDAISKRDGERFFDYVRRCGRNPLAKRVKLADLDDNSDPRRRFGPNYASLLVRYQKARAILLGNAE